MLTLTGTLRQFGDVTFGDDKKSFLKLWVEHETPRDNGPADLRIEELLLPGDVVQPSDRASLKAGAPVSVVVRFWAKGRDVVFAAVRLVGGAGNAPGAATAK